MDITAIRNDPNPEGRISQEISPHTDTKSESEIAVLPDIKPDEELDALSAVKLDPAVLEAHIIINRSEKNEHTPESLTKKTKDAESQRRFDFDMAMCMQRAALMSLSGPQMNLLMQYVDGLRLQRYSTQRQQRCAFCKNNGHSEVWYTNHVLKDEKGRVRCPVLRAFMCPRCGATGDHAHTIKYCPNNY